MLEILFRVEVEPLKRKEFIDFIEWDAKVARDPKQEPRTLWFDYYDDPRSPSAFFVYEAYRDEAAFTVHQSHDPYKHWKAWIMPNVLRLFQPMFEKGQAVRSTSLSSHDLNTLKDLNEELAVMEQQRDEKANDWFNGLLSDQLKFRRATGSIVDKQTFLKALRDPSPFTLRESEDISIIGLEDDRALVMLVVWTKKADHSENRFRNIRLFSKQKQGWILERWYNYELTNL